MQNEKIEQETPTVPTILYIHQVLEDGLRRVMKGTDQTVAAQTETLLKAIQEQELVHDHGTCEDCARLNQESYSKGENAGMAQTVKYYEAISGVTELRQEAELLKATIKLVP